MLFKYLNDYEFWLSVLFVLCTYKWLLFFFRNILNYIKKEAVEEYKKGGDLSANIRSKAKS